jgi:AcrR family transcriptional regulator
MIADPISRTKRLSRQESKAHTRERLLAVGREHFLRRGLNGSTAEEISEDAGYSRGALHSNFEDKEGLFLEVVRQGHQRQCELFARLLRESSGDELLGRFRESFANLLCDPDFLLIVELELGALCSEKLRKDYVDFYGQALIDAREIIQDILATTDITISMETDDFILAMMSFTHGLATKQALLGSLIRAETTRKMVLSMFDAVVSRRQEKRP